MKLLVLDTSVFDTKCFVDLGNIANKKTDLNGVQLSMRKKRRSQWNQEETEKDLALENKILYNQMYNVLQF